MRLKVVAVGVTVVAMLGACGEPPVDRSSQATPKAATQDTEVNRKAPTLTSGEIMAKQDKPEPKPEPKAVQEKAEPTPKPVQEKAEPIIAEEQAMLSAQDYLDYTSFSRTGLIDQLIYEGFTQEQATFGVNQTGL